ncbi:uncharacterized protein LOC144016227 [Festucalex cinctus]
MSCCEDLDQQFKAMKAAQWIAVPETQEVEALSTHITPNVAWDHIIGWPMSYWLSTGNDITVAQDSVDKTRFEMRTSRLGSQRSVSKRIVFNLRRIQLTTRRCTCIGIF